MMKGITNRRLRLADADGITAEAVERERIAQSHRDYRGEAGHPWAIYDGPTHPWSHTVTRAIASQYRVVAEVPLPLWRRVLRWMRGVGR
jgi:hypothetical protein